MAALRVGGWVDESAGGSADHSDDEKAGSMDDLLVALTVLM